MVIDCENVREQKIKLKTRIYKRVRWVRWGTVYRGITERKKKEVEEEEGEE